MKWNKKNPALEKKKESKETLLFYGKGKDDMY